MMRAKTFFLHREGSLEWGAPVFFTHAPDGVLFEFATAPTARLVVTDKACASETRTSTEKTPSFLNTLLSHPALETPPPDITLPYTGKETTLLKMEWCWIPGGAFRMGSKEYDDEKPAREVRVKGFWLARYPVTNAQYQLFIEASGYQNQRWWTTDGWRICVRK